MKGRKNYWNAASGKYEAVKTPASAERKYGRQNQPNYIDNRPIKITNDSDIMLTSEKHSLNIMFVINSFGRCRCNRQSPAAVWSA